MPATDLPKVLDGPVGLRWGSQNVTNRLSDQEKVIDLLANIAEENGGQQTAWRYPPLAGSDGFCLPILVNAIKRFQQFWTARRQLRVVDGVVDKGGASLRLMNELADRGVPPPPPAPGPSGEPFIVNPRQPGTWQIVNAWSATVGEVGQIGAVQLDIAQPDEKKFRVTGAGAGFGVGVDPLSYLELLKKVDNPVVAFTLRQFVEMLAKGVGFNLGDYLQKLGVSLPSVTGGRIIPNPLNRFFNRPTSLTKTMVASIHQPFSVASASGGVLAGMEGGLLVFGLPDLLNCTALGVYGSSGVTLKVGAGIGWMIYSTTKVENV